MALSGGVGGAKLALGLAHHLPAAELVIAANVGDDFEHLGLTICPDIDTLVYTLSGLANPETGWGRAGDTSIFMQALAALDGETWFHLGDGDLAMHVARSHRLHTGDSLSRITADICSRFGIETRILPASDDPVRTMYDLLAALAPDKQVKTAYEPDDSIYGPAIFRIYHSETGHGPHFDSVRKRTRALDYQITRFEYQFAAVLCLQNARADEPGGEPFLYNCSWSPEVQEYLDNNTFDAYTAAHHIDRIQVQLEPGDLYFFFTENIHEVPLVQGEIQRGVLAIFFAMSADDDEIFVWA